MRSPRDRRAPGVYLSETRAAHRREGSASSSFRLGGSSALALGSRFGTRRRYEIGELLGAGGSAVVYRVRDLEGGATLAGKFTLPTPQGFGQSALQREGVMLARLRHENIVSLVGTGCDHDLHYLLLEYVDGQTLAKRMARSRLSALRATQVLIDVAAALAHAHQRDVLHLDLKPSNVILLPSGRAKIIDFGAGSMPAGLWQRADGGSRPHGDCDVTTSRFVKGTVHYMAPEQWSLEPLHPSTDLWGAGMLYYELLTGELPFGTQPTCLRLRSSESEFVPFSSAAYGVPGAVEHILARTLARDPRERFSRATALRDALVEVEADLALAESA